MSPETDLICSSHTISGVMPGGPIAARHPFEARVAACAAAGYSGMCLHFRDYRELRAAGRADAELRETLACHAMRHVSIEFLLDWFLDDTAAEQAKVDEVTAFAAAHAYGATSLNVGADFQGRGFSRAHMRTKFRELGERAGEAGLALALEIVPWSDVRTIEDAMETIGDVPNAGLVVDSWHVFRGGITLAELTRIPAERIACIQINDAPAVAEGPPAEETQRRRFCGEGEFDLSGFLHALNRTGTRFPVSVEVISPELARMSVDKAAVRSIAGARQLVDKLAIALQ